MTNSKEKRTVIMKKGKMQNFWFPRIEKNIRATSREAAEKIVEKMGKKKD